MSEGAQRIAAERQRQLEMEKWTPEHDDEHDGDEIALAAACYATPVRHRKMVRHSTAAPGMFPDRGDAFWLEPELWPWEGEFKPAPTDRIRELVKAGALLAAEIDRLLRKAESQDEMPPGETGP